MYKNIAPPPPPFCQLVFAIHSKNMNEELPPSGLNRRSFIKRSVVAAVAVSSMTIFSGLVNAQTEVSSGTQQGDAACTGAQKQSKYWCEITSKNGTVYQIYECEKSGSNVVVGYCAQKSGSNSTDYSTNTMPAACIEDSQGKRKCTLNP
jgi:hypothetical protein